MEKNFYWNAACSRASAKNQWSVIVVFLSIRASLDSFSGHADKNELKRYVEAIQGNIKKVFVVHGEEDQALAFAATLRAMKPVAEVVVPEYKQVVEF